MIIASTHDFREAARRKLPHFLFEYIDGGSYDERTLHANVDDLKQISLRQRVLRPHRPCTQTKRIGESARCHDGSLNACMRGGRGGQRVR